MKKYFALILSLVPLLTIAQTTLFVPISPNECLNCVSQLAKLNDIDKTLPVTLVFPKRYKSDSAALSKKMYLNDYKADIVWSDSLFKLFESNDNIKSSVGAYNEESGKYINVNIASIGESLPFFNALNKTDTLSLKSRAFGGETILKNSGRYIYCFDRTAREIRAFDKVSAQSLYTLSVTDSMVQAAFKLRYPASQWKQEYQEAQEFTTTRKRIDPYAFKAMYCSNDTVYAIAHYAYIVRDTAYKNEITFFLTLAVYKQGRLIEFSLLENYIDPSFKGVNRGLHRLTIKGEKMKSEDAYYILGGEFFVNNGIFYSELLGYLVRGAPNHILSFHKKNAKKIYEHTGFYKGTLPIEYFEGGYNKGLFPVSGILYSYPYVALVYSNHIFSIDDKIDDFEVTVLPQVPHGYVGIFDFKVSGDYAYFIYRNGKDKWLHYAKVDIKTQKTVNDVAFWDTTLPYVADNSIDDFDYRFVNIPIDEQTILRKKVLD